VRRFLLSPNGLNVAAARGMVWGRTGYVEENTLADTRVYVGHQMLRLASQTWLPSSNDRQHLLKSLRGTRWQRQLAETAA